MCASSGDAVQIVRGDTFLVFQCQPGWTEADWQTALAGVDLSAVQCDLVGFDDDDEGNEIVVYRMSPKLERGG